MISSQTAKGCRKKPVKHRGLFISPMIGQIILGRINEETLDSTGELMILVRIIAVLFAT